MVRRTQLLIALAVVTATIALAQSPHTSPPSQKVIGGTSTDVAAIQRLRDKDIAASKAGDYKTLFSLFTEDAVVMQPGMPFIRTPEARREALEQTRAAMSAYEVVDYFEDFEELHIIGDHAIEWGTIRGTMRNKKTGKVESSAVKVLRVLRRQPDGEWKIAKSIFNDYPAPKDN